MNPNKIGLFIAKLRKEKNMTQQELGDLLGISGKSISKWERGINCPDISILNEVAGIFDISVDELLSGEKIIKKENNYFKKLLFLTILVLIILSFILIVNNHYQYKVYHIESNSSLLDVNGYIIFNPDNEIFLINSLNYNGELTKETNEVTITLISNNKELFTYHSNNNQVQKNIAIILKETSINIKKASSIDTINNLFLIISFNNEKIKIPLRISEKLTNNIFK